MDEYFMPKGRVHEPGKSDPEFVISMFHQTLTVQEPALGCARYFGINADSRSFRNKNNATISSLRARVAEGHHDQFVARFMLKVHTRFSVTEDFGHVRNALKKHDSGSLKSLITVLSRPVSFETINFMCCSIYEFEILGNMSKDVYVISRACEIEVLNVSGVPLLYVQGKLEENALRLEKVGLATRRFPVRASSVVDSI